MSLIFSEGGIGGVTEEELQKAVNELQSQIDTISAASDCTDIVGTYTDLQNYDTSTLTDNDIIKVLNDTTHNGQPSYYRWSASTDQFTYIGSEERVNDGTLTIKYGTETVGTFSANQSTNATVNLPSTDLSNYYNKTETNSLLNEKQDVLTPNDPLTISTYAKNNLEGFTLTFDGTGAYSESTWGTVCIPGWRSSGGADTGFEYVGYAMNYNQDNGKTFGMPFSATSIPEYIDIPYSLGEVVTMPSLGTSGTISNFLLGYIDSSGTFIPTAGIGGVDKVFVTNSSTPAIANDKQILFARDELVGTELSRNISNLPQCQVVQLSIDENGVVDCYCHLQYAGSWNYSYTKHSTSATTDQINRLKQTNIIRVVPIYQSMSWGPYTREAGYNSSSAYPLNQFGKYNIGSQLLGVDITDFDDVIATGNLFDISGEQVYNYLDLHIGTGLAVQNGNLVNTNPTAPTVMIGATSSTAGTSGLVPAPAAGDDTKFLSGDGTFKTISGPDMSNYYNKTQTDALLSEKQDILTPNDPLTITNYAKSNLNGLSYTQDTTGLYSNVEGAVTSINISSNQVQLSATTGSDLWGGGYIDIPYTFGQYIATGHEPSPENVYSDGFKNSHIIFGKFIHEKFIPILIIRNASYTNGVVTLSDTPLSETSTEVVYATQNVDCRDSSPQVPSDNTLAGIYKISFDGTKYNISSRCRWDGLNAYINNYTLTTNSTLIQRISEITTVRIAPYYQLAPWKLATPYSIGKLGLYNDFGNLTNETFTSGNLGENLFDITGVQTFNYLDLHIGTGLAVQNGNLVNTNPTPVDISTKVTGTGVTDIRALTQAEYEALTTPDATTMYVLTDSGAIYLGTILIVNNTASNASE